MGLLAVVIDDALVQLLQSWLPTIATALGTIAVAIGGGLWRGYAQLKAFLGPLVKGFFVEHTALAAEMKTQAPVVAASLTKLSEASDRHEELHAQTAKKLEGQDAKLDKIIGHLSNRELPTSDNKGT